MVRLASMTPTLTVYKKAEGVAVAHARDFSYHSGTLSHCRFPRLSVPDITLLLHLRHVPVRADFGDGRWHETSDPGLYFWPGHADRGFSFAVPLPQFGLHLSPQFLARTVGDAFAIRPGAALLDPLLEGVLYALTAPDVLARPLSLYPESLAVAAAVHLSERYAERPVKDRPSGKLSSRAEKDVVDLIEARYAEQLSLADLAAATGLSPGHFLLLFRATFGAPPHRYLQMRRLSAARQLIARHPNWTLAAVAQRSGFCDQSHLTRAFQAKYGMTPGEFRAGQNRKGVQISR